MTLADTAGVPRVRVHGLRGCYALLAALRSFRRGPGTPSSASRWEVYGHLYGHLYDEQNGAAALSLRNLIRPQKLEA